MNTKLHQFEKLSHLKLHIYSKDTLDLDMPYEKKTIERIKKDLETLSTKSSQSNSSFRIHAIYPQCYILVWSNIDLLPKDNLLFSEVIYTVENNTILPVICCQKCNRIVDTTYFKIADHEYLQLAGQHLIHFLSNTEKEISYYYTKRHIQHSSSSTSVCKTVLDEIDMDYTSHDMHFYIVCLARSIVVSDSLQIQDCYQKLFSLIQTSSQQEEPQKKILSLAPYIMTSLIYELQNLLPASSEMLQHSLQVFFI
jgi:hypothetical protein